ncbi:MAG: DNA polymerase [Metamycoplasmataceae bacterium]
MGSRYYTKNRDYWFCGDTETVTANSQYFKEKQDTRVNLWCLKQWGQDKYIEDVNVESLINFLISLNNSSTVFFHFLGFDGDFILKYRINKLDANIVNEPKKTYNHMEIEFFKNYNTIYYIRIHIVRKSKRFMIILRCSMMLLASSIYDLGNSLGLQKLESDLDYEPFAKIEDVPKEYLEYCRRDVLIAEKSLINMECNIANLGVIQKYNLNRQNYNKKNFTIFGCLTISRLSLTLQKLYLHHYNYRRSKKEKISLYLNNIDDWKTLRPFYYGGFTEFNIDYQSLNFTDPFKVKGFVLDIVSAYPWAMSGDLPYGPLLYDEPLGKHTIWIKVNVKRAKLKNMDSNFICLKNWNIKGQRYVKELTNFTCYYNIEEWEFLNTLYDFEVISYQKWYQKTASYLKIYVETIFDLKKKAKSANKKGEEKTYKILLNSGYGVYGQRTIFDNNYYTKEVYSENELFTKKLEVKGKIVENQYIIKRETKAYHLSDKYKSYIIQKTDLPKKTLNIGLASYVTAKVRIHLWKNIKKIGLNKWLYSDTDSIFAKYLKLSELQKKVSIGDNLGDWSVEKSFEYINTRGAKSYAIYDINKNPIKIGSAGISKKHTKKLFEYDNLNSNEIKLEKCTLTKLNMQSGIILMEKDKVLHLGRL